MRSKKNIILYTVFAAYTILMFWLLFGQRLQVYLNGTWTKDYWADFAVKINLIPFSTIAEYWNELHSGGRAHAFINLAGNVIMFVPLGFFVPQVFRGADTFRRSMLWSLITILSVEILQLFTLLGSLDVDDLILNMIGAAVGYGVYAVLYRRRKEGRRQT